VHRTFSKNTVWLQLEHAKIFIGAALSKGRYGTVPRQVCM
jgi:hypothetical protein